MSNNESEPLIESVDVPVDVPPRTGRLLDPSNADAVEAADREKPIPGGAPHCPLCGSEMLRHVEKHPAPRGDDSPFRVRLVCPSDECGAWTVYDW